MSQKEETETCGCPYKIMPESYSYEWGCNACEQECDDCGKLCCWQCGTAFCDDDCGIEEITAWCGRCSRINTMKYYGV